MGKTCIEVKAFHKDSNPEIIALTEQIIEKIQRAFIEGFEEAGQKLKVTEGLISSAGCENLNATDRPSALIYDCEIINCIPGQTEPLPGLQFCEGWEDWGGMGLACIGVYDYLTDRYRVFLEDNFDQFAALVKEREHIIGFNSFLFDDVLCKANKIEVRTTFDVLLHLRKATGQRMLYTHGVTKPGFNLDNLAKLNFGTGKTGHGAQAPALWQTGHIGQVIDYCLADVALTRQLFERPTVIVPDGEVQLGIVKPFSL